MVLKESLFEEVAFRVMTQITQVGHEKVKGENENQGPKKDKFITHSRNNKNRSMWPEHST